MDYAVGVLLAFDLLWLVGFFILRWLKDIPMGVNVRAQGKAARESEQRAIKAQNDIFQFWRTRLLWVAAAVFILAIVLMVVAR